MIDVKARIDFREQGLLRARDRGFRRAASRYLAIVRQDARKAIKIKAPSKRDFRTAQMSARADRRRAARRRIAEKRRMTSRPGAPPFAHLRGNRGIRLIQYAVEGLTGLVGYVKFNAKGRDVPKNLEHGGGQVKARPNILPTANRLLPKFAQFLKDSME